MSLGLASRCSALLPLSGFPLPGLVRSGDAKRVDCLDPADLRCCFGSGRVLEWLLDVRWRLLVRQRVAPFVMCDADYEQ